MKRKVLFVCIHNSARSQMAEALMNKVCGDEFEAESAGIEPGVLNPLAVEVLRERQIDISRKQTRGVLELFQSGRLFSYVITVCDETSAERCPIFPGIAKRLHWAFTDPSQFDGTSEEKLVRTREVCDSIESKIREFCIANCAVKSTR
jgi:arsenate reductase